MKTIIMLLAILISSKYKAQEIDKKCFPPNFDRGMKDEILETKLLLVFNEFRQTNAAKTVMNKSDCEKEAVKLYIESKEWFLSRNQNSGVIVGRYLNTLVFSKDKEKNKCSRRHIRFFYNYDGKNYSEVPNIIVGYGEKIKCECAQ